MRKECTEALKCNKPNPGSKYSRQCASHCDELTCEVTTSMAQNRRAPATYCTYEPGHSAPNKWNWSNSSQRPGAYDAYVMDCSGVSLTNSGSSCNAKNIYSGSFHITEAKQHIPVLSRNTEIRLLPCYEQRQVAELGFRDTIWVRGTHSQQISQKQKATPKLHNEAQETQLLGFQRLSGQRQWIEDIHVGTKKADLS